jgi:hypothetical protein
MMTEITHDGSKLRKILSLADDLSSATSEAHACVSQKLAQFAKEAGESSS